MPGLLQVVTQKREDSIRVGIVSMRGVNRKLAAEERVLAEDDSSRSGSELLLQLFKSFHFI